VITLKQPSSCAATPATGSAGPKLNCLGELASRTANGHQARDHHAQALAIARATNGAGWEDLTALAPKQSLVFTPHSPGQTCTS
jgi:hypothetical protein